MHIRYDAPDGSYAITVATTRRRRCSAIRPLPSTRRTPRYQHLIGKPVVIPVVGREIPIVADAYCKMEFGTGAVKITPGHDPNDFEVGRRAGLPILRVFTDDGHINELGGKYEGLDRFACRKALRCGSGSLWRAG